MRQAYATGHFKARTVDRVAFEKGGGCCSQVCGGVVASHCIQLHRSVRILLHFAQFCIRRQVHRPRYGPWEHFSPRD